MITQLDLDNGHSLEAAQRELGYVKALMESPGWKILESYARLQVVGRQADARMIPNSIGEFLQREQAAGAITAIELFCTYPTLLKEGFEQLIANLKLEEPNHE